MADDSKDGSEKDRNAPTVRDLKGPSALPTDTIPDVVGQYVPPRPPPEVSRHRTIDLQPVRLSDQADPRRWRTERRLVRPDRPAPRHGLSLALAAGLVLLLALGAWAFLRTHAASTEARPAPVPAPHRPPIPSAAVPAPVPVPVPVPVEPTTPAPVASSAEGEKAESPSLAPGAPKPLRPRDVVKKRKDPWLE